MKSENEEWPDGHKMVALAKTGEREGVRGLLVGPPPKSDSETAAHAAEDRMTEMEKEGNGLTVTKSDYRSSAWSLRVGAGKKSGVSLSD